MNNDIKPVKPAILPPKPELPPTPPRSAFAEDIPRNQESKLPRKNHKPLKIRRYKKPYLILAAVLGALILMIAGLVAWYTVQLQPANRDGHARRVTIEVGTTMPQIANDLDEQGLIKNSLAFQWYVRTKGLHNSLQAGNYALSPSQSVNDIVNHLVEGKVDALRVTILPGKTLKDLQKVLVNGYGFEASAVERALSADYDHPLLASKPAEASLEGYIFPETYEIQANSTPEELIEKSFDVFYERLNSSGVVSKLQQRGFNLFQGITLASIIQQEVPDAKTQKQVSQVFQKRLNEDMVLGSDVTFIYAAKQLGVTANPSLDSPYNTRINRGLPPGPIANFNMSALEAVINPSAGDYLFFVAGDGDYAGQTFFARTEAEHDQNVANYCRELCR